MVYRVPGFLSSRPYWILPLIRPQENFAPPPPFRFNMGDTLAYVGGGERDTIPMMEQTLWYSKYTIFHVRYVPVADGFFHKPKWFLLRNTLSATVQ